MIRAILIFLLLFGSCTKSIQPPNPDRLRISFALYPPSIDPRFSSDFTSSTLICLVFEGLTQCQAGGNIELALSEKVDISPDQLTYIFHLRPSLWSDGTAVTAYDFEKSWKKILDPSFQSPTAYLFYCIRNARDAYQGKISLDAVGIRCIDEKTLMVVLEHPAPYFLSLTATPAYLPVPPDREEQFEILNGNKPIPFVSNGPFTIQQIQPNAQIDLKKNDLHWNKKTSNSMRFRSILYRIQ